MSETTSRPSTIKEGQSIKFIPREANSEARVVSYYDFYSNLQGTVTKLYDDGTAAVIIDRASLPDDARDRHEKSERDMRDKWMRSLSEEDRNKLSDIQKQFNLRYTLLVSTTDLIDIKATPPVIPEKTRKSVEKPISEPRRPTEDAISAAEEAHLEELKRAKTE
jgi:hypothetical protein